MWNLPFRFLDQIVVYIFHLSMCTTCGGRSVGIVRLRTKGHGVSLCVLHVLSIYYPSTFNHLDTTRFITYIIALDNFLHSPDITFF
jgi:hypothetical protein